MKKFRICSLMLCISLLFTLLPATVQAIPATGMCNYEKYSSFSPNMVVGFGGLQWNLIGNDGGGIASSTSISSMTLLA